MLRSWKAAGFLLLLLAVSTGCGYFRYSRNFTHPDRPVYLSEEFLLTPAASDTLRVVTFNIYYAERIEEAIEQLQSEELAGSEIVLLQEMDSPGVHRIAEALGLSYVFYPAVIHPRHQREFGNAILVRGAILDHAKILLSHGDPTGMQRIAVYARVRLRDREIGIYSTHLSTRIPLILRGVMAQEVARHAEAVAPEICIAGGDWNTMNEVSIRAVREPFRELGFVLATRQVDWSWELRFLGVPIARFPFDHILTRGVEVIEGSRARKVADASDHAPIWTRVVLPGVSSRPMGSDSTQD